MKKISEKDVRAAMEMAFKAKGGPPEFIYHPELHKMLRADGVEVCPQCCKPECMCRPDAA